MKRVRTIHGQVRKLTEGFGPYSVYSRFRYVAFFTKDGFFYLKLNTYNGDRDRNRQAFNELQKELKFPEAVKLLHGHLEYAPEIKTMYLQIQTK